MLPVGGDELIREMCPHALGAQTAEVEVEVAMDRHELADFDAGGDAAFAQPLFRPETGRVVVAGDIEAAQRRGRGQIEGGEVIGREPGNDRHQGQHRFERQHGLDAFAGGEDVPRLRVVSREISEELGGCLVAEASQTGAIVVGDEGVEVGVAFGMVAKAAMGPQLRSLLKMLAEAAIEAFDHAVGLRVKRTDQTVDDAMPGAGAIEGVVARWFVVRLELFVDGKAIGEFGAVVGQHGVNGEREAGEKAFEEPCRGDGAAIGQDLEIDKAGGAVDRDISVAAAAVERRQVFDVDTDKPRRRRGVEGGRRCLLRGEAGADAMALQAAVNGAARQLWVDAAYSG